jgi:diadenosine tetraphosphate (Ap4A) HIT family hydrolase
MDQIGCPFCQLDTRQILLSNDFAAAFADAFPIAEGHTLVVPKRHVASLFDLVEDEQTSLWRLVALSVEMVA